mmetsp:Transcript_14370/g.23782  ORF Transcript_14370/g.23782 Transcript_14370/m.23782 type:complete len:1036 (-) Transcript_14370:2826-5933(-)
MGCSSSKPSHGADTLNAKCENRPKQFNDDDNENILDALYDMTADTCDSSIETGGTTVESYPIESVKAQNLDLRSGTLVKGGSQTNVSAVTKVKPSSKPKPCPHKPADRTSLTKTSSYKSCGDRSSASDSSGGGVSALSSASVAVHGRPPSLNSDVENYSERYVNTMEVTLEQPISSIPPVLPPLDTTSSVLPSTLREDDVHTSDSAHSDSSSSPDSEDPVFDRTEADINTGEIIQSTKKNTSKDSEDTHIVGQQFTVDNVWEPPGESAVTLSIGAILSPDVKPATTLSQSSDDTTDSVDIVSDNMSVDVMEESSKSKGERIESNPSPQVQVSSQPTQDPPSESMDSCIGLTEAHDGPPVNDPIMSSGSTTSDHDVSTSSPVVEVILSKETDDTFDDGVCTNTVSVNFVEECADTTSTATLTLNDSDILQSTTPVLDKSIKIEDDALQTVREVSSIHNCDDSVGETVPEVITSPPLPSGTAEGNSISPVETVVVERGPDPPHVSDQIQDSNDFSDLKERIDALKEIKMVKEVVPRRETYEDIGDVDGRPLTARERLKLRVARSQSARLPVGSTTDTDVEKVTMPALSRSQSLSSPSRDTLPPVPPHESEERSSETRDGKEDISARSRLADRLAKSKLLRESLSPQASDQFKTSLSDMHEGSPDSTKKASSDGSETPISSKLKRVLSKSRQLRESFNDDSNNISGKDVSSDDCMVSRTGSRIDSDADSDSDSISVSDCNSSNCSVSSDEISYSGCAGGSRKEPCEDETFDGSDNSSNVTHEIDPSLESPQGESSTNTTSPTGPDEDVLVDATSARASTGARAIRSKDSTKNHPPHAKAVNGPTRRSSSLSKAKSKASLNQSGTAATNSAYNGRKKYKSPVPKQSSIVKSSNAKPSASTKQVYPSDTLPQRRGVSSQNFDSAPINTIPATSPKQQSLARRSSGDASISTVSPVKGLSTVSDSISDLKSENYQIIQTKNDSLSRFPSKIPSLTRDSSDGSFGNTSCSSPAAVGGSGTPRVRSNSRRPSLIPQKSVNNCG